MATPPVSSSLNAEDPQLLEQVFGAFPGYSAPIARLEQLLAINVKRHHFAEAADAMATAWWDYRIMSPAKSFMLFVYYRAEMTERFLRMQGNRKLQWIVRNIKPAHVWQTSPRNITGLWNAKVAADTFCIPYRDFIMLSLQLAQDDGWQRLPSPAQWYSAGRMLRVTEVWEETLGASLKLAKHPVFGVNQYCGAPVQDEYQHWLCRQVAKQRALTRAMSQTIFEQPQITRDKAVCFFGEEKVSEAESFFRHYHS